jgi:hypothetical protein
MRVRSPSCTHLATSGSLVYAPHGAAVEQAGGWQSCSGNTVTFSHRPRRLHEQQRHARRREGVVRAVQHPSQRAGVRQHGAVCGVGQPQARGARYAPASSSHQTLTRRIQVAAERAARHAAGHVLVIPRRVVTRFSELRAEEVTDLWCAAAPSTVVASLHTTIRLTGWRARQDVGATSGQQAGGAPASVVTHPGHSGARETPWWRRGD